MIVVPITDDPAPDDLPAHARTVEVTGTDVETGLPIRLRTTLCWLGEGDARWLFMHFQRLGAPPGSASLLAGEDPAR